MDFDALLDESLGDVDYDELERGALAPKAPPAPAPSRKAGPAPVTSHALPKPYKPIASTSRAPPAPSASSAHQPAMTQKTLFGGNASQPVQVRQAPGIPAPVPQATQEPKTVATKICKTWDRSRWAESGWGRSTKQTKKGKKRALDDEEPFDQDPDDYEDEPAFALEQEDPELTAPKAPPMRLSIDKQEAPRWIFPLMPGRQIRDYQLNIAHKTLFNNVLCSLPTGLGKTFIAAVVMMNFYRCFPEGKVIFTAPTKPLVAQQIQACHAVGGIPNHDSCEMTGEDTGASRAQAWKDRRVFYCTPQTVTNDLKSGRLDASKVVLVVVDEAHRASGDYAYCTIVRFLMAKNPHFRLLALTATPGSKSETVQAVIDNLHIGHIEVRTEQSLDIQPHIHQKVQDIRIISLTPDIIHLRDLLYKLLEEPLNRLKSRQYIFINSVEKLSPFHAQLARTKLNADRELNASAKGMYWAAINQLDPLARALENLLTKSVASCFSKLKEIKSGQFDDEAGGGSGTKGKKNSKTSAKIASSEAFVTLFRETQQVMSAPGGDLHPKMVVMLDDMKAHFQAAEDRGEQTRVMVFCSHRDMVEELVEYINRERPLLRAERFIGQGSDTKGRKGFNQKQQLDVVAKFKGGAFNVLVATSIGEEGLDIGEVDVIYCYDAQKSPIRMLQRVGRTGRARQGKIVVLMAEGKEEGNWQRATDSYNDVQNALVQGRALALYEDCDQLFPDRKIPCEKVELQSAKYEKQNIALSSRATSRASTKEKKPSRTSKAAADLPTFFQKGSDVLASRKQRGGRKSAAQETSVPFEPELTEEEALNKRKKQALPTMQELDELAAMSWPDSASNARVSRNRITTNQPLRVSTSSCFAAPSKRLEHALVGALSRELAPEAYDEWQSSTWTGFRQSDVYWWADEDMGSSKGSWKPCKPGVTGPVGRVDVEAVKRARLDVDAFDLHVTSQQRRMVIEDEAEDSMLAEKPAAAGNLEGSDDDEDEDPNEMDDFIVPDEEPVVKANRRSEPKLKPPKSSLEFSDEDFDSALALDSALPEAQPKRDPPPSTKRPPKVKSQPLRIIDSDEDSDDGEVLPDLSKAKPRNASQRNPEATKPKPAAPARRVVELLSDEERDDIKAHPPQSGSGSKARAPAFTFTAASSAPEETAPNVLSANSPRRYADEINADVDGEENAEGLDSSDEEMSSMPKLPQLQNEEVDTVAPVEQEWEAAQPQATCALVGDLGEEDDEDMFDSFALDPVDLARLDEPHEKNDRLRELSPATLAMPPPLPATIARKRDAQDFEEADDPDSSTAQPVKIRKGPAGRARVVDDSSSPAVRQPGPSRAPLSDSSSSAVKQPPGARRLQRGDPSQRPKPESTASAHVHANAEGKPKKSKGKRQKKKAAKNPFIAGSQAVCSDGSNNPSSDEEEKPDSSDREALTDGEVDLSSDMERFYKDSIKTQQPVNARNGAQFANQGFRGAAYKMSRGDQHFVATQRASSEPLSDYMDSSFCVGDDVVEFDSDHGHPDGLPSDM